MAFGPEDVQEGVELPSLAVMDALRTTFGLYRRHFLTFALVMGSVVLPMFLISATAELALAQRDEPVTRSEQAQWSRDRRYTQQAVDLVRLLLWPFAGGAAVIVAANALQGQSLSVGGAYRWAGRRFRALIVAGFLISLVTSPARTQMLTPMLPVSALLAWLAVGVGFAISLQFVNQALLFEDRGVFSAFRRSWQLSSGHRLKIGCCLLPLYAISSLVMGGPAFVYGFLLALGWHGAAIWMPLTSSESVALAANRIFLQSLTVSGQILTGALFPILGTVLYFRLHAREVAQQPQPEGA